MEEFCAKTKASGQLCFDFMLNQADGHLYAFECNPRTSTVLLEYHDHPLFAEALGNPEVLHTSTYARFLLQTIACFHASARES